MSMAPFIEARRQWNGSYTFYFLARKLVTLREGAKRLIFYFAPLSPRPIEERVYYVVENPRSSISEEMQIVIARLMAKRGVPRHVAAQSVARLSANYLSPKQVTELQARIYGAITGSQQ